MIKRSFEFCTVTLLLGFNTLLAQENPPEPGTDKFSRNSVYVELLGTGSMYSINYDHIFYHKGTLSLLGRIGLTYTPIIEGQSDFEGPGVIPEIGALLGKNKNKLEIGFGGGLHHVYDEPEDFGFLILAPRIGYRRQMPQGGFLFRFAFTPWVPVVIDNKIDKDDVEPTFLPMLGISLGYTFKK